MPLVPCVHGRELRPAQLRLWLEADHVEVRGRHKLSEAQPTQREVLDKPHPCCVMLIVAPALVALAHVGEHLEQLGVLKDDLVGSGERR